MDKKDLFKAKKIGSGEWVVGNRIDDVNTGQVFIHPVEELLIRRHNDNNVANTSLVAYEVDPVTVSRYSGLCDKKGMLIWENDICRYYNSEDGDGIGIIKSDYVLWKKGTISIRHKMTPLFYLQCSDEWENIGNSFDNPELLESSNELEEEHNL